MALLFVVVVVGLVVAVRSLLTASRRPHTKALEQPVSHRAEVGDDAGAHVAAYALAALAADDAADSAGLGDGVSLDDAGASADAGGAVDGGSGDAATGGFDVSSTGGSD